MTSLHYMLEHGLCLKCARTKCYHHPDHTFLGARFRRRWIKQGEKREFMQRFPPLDPKGFPNTQWFFELQQRELMWLNYKTFEHLDKLRFR